MTKDYSMHIVKNITKGSMLCPFGAAAMKMRESPKKLDSTKDLKLEDFNTDGSATAESESEPEPKLPSGEF